MCQRTGFDVSFFELLREMDEAIAAAAQAGGGGRRARPGGALPSGLRTAAGHLLPAALLSTGTRAVLGLAVRLAAADRVLDPAAGFLAILRRRPRCGHQLPRGLSVLDGDAARWAPITDWRGGPLRVKAEGLALHPTDPDRAWVVLDCDGPAVAAELLDVALDGPWAC